MFAVTIGTRVVDTAEISKTTTSHMEEPIDTNCCSAFYFEKRGVWMTVPGETMFDYATPQRVTAWINNTTVKRVSVFCKRLNVSPVQRFEVVLPIIRYGGNVVTFCLFNALQFYCDRYIQAVVQNASISTVWLESSDVNMDELHSLVSSPHIRVLDLNRIEIMPLSVDSLRCLALETAFRANCCESVWLGRLFTDEYYVSILKGLSTPDGESSLIRLKLDDLPTPTVRLSNALKDLLISKKCSKLKALDLCRLQLPGPVFQPMADGIRSSLSVTGITIYGCRFDNESTLEFERLFHSSETPNKNVAHLRVTSATFSRPICPVLCGVLGPKSCLIELTIDAVDGIESVMSVVDESPMLSSLTILNVNTSAKLRAIAETLRKLRFLKSFRFNISNILVERDASAKQGFMEACRGNTGLENVLNSDAFFDDNDRVALRRYAARNRALDMLISSPFDIPVSVWPSIWKSVHECHYGHDIVCRTLQELGASVALAQQRVARKRRRAR